ncbi:hypothetical protein AOZ06_47375 [Kibdelosporangium phytohabitans]|uniref:Uncharacterized protein n=1 Tax=Kibdelosporangium phytohabitans TaxID=860235 RepID=A0A0N7F579_9PSEU|nr:hypothetical protein AOZ06_47375 [Kibdelosporangium phytohabitans]
MACFDWLSKPFDTAWTLSYNRERPVIGEYGPPERFGHVQVTAYGPGPDYCVLGNLWFTTASDAIVRNVECYNASGKLAKHESFVACTSRQWVLTILAAESLLFGKFPI